ncbi:hypothetical protein KW791_00455 [Candidatus Parcubacteria bacterium]|nr:hypothetical protein [Candidatus Parcubacteria bacterium]
MDPKDPESLENVKEIEITQDVIDFVTDLDSEVETHKGYRGDWEARIDNYTRKRYGIRAKKSFPWVGCANFVLPQIDSDINRLKPAYINLAYGVSPIVTFEPFGPEDVLPARKRELLFDWRMRSKVKFFKEYALGVDYMLHCGFVVFFTGWRFETRTYCKYLNLSDLPQDVLDALYLPEATDDVLFHVIAEEMLPDLNLQENVDEIKRVVAEFRAGKTKFEFEFTEIYENRADVKACNPREEILFPVDTINIQEAPFIDRRFYMRKNKIKSLMKSNKYITFDDNEINSWATDTTESNADYVKAVRDGKSFQNYDRDGEVCLRERCTWYDVNGDGIEERVMVTHPESNPSKILRFIENPYDHGLFPFTVVRREFNDAEILSSRGVPALDDDFQTGISTIFNQDIDAGTISTTPTVVARKNSVKNLRNLRYVPGQVVETENGAADYTVTQNPNLGQAGRFASMQYLKSWANDRIGNTTAAISQANNSPGNGPQGSKTAREVSAIESNSGMLQSMDLLVFQNQMVDLYFQIDSLYEQFGDDEEEFMITNQQSIKVSRREIQGSFNLIPNGRLDNANPALRAQKMLAMLQMFINDPFIRQDAIRKLYLDDYDVRISQQLLKSPQELQEDAMQQMQSQNDQLQTALLMQKGRDNLEIRKEAILAPITGRKYGPG